MSREEDKNISVFHNEKSINSNLEDEETTIRQWLGFTDEESNIYRPDYFNEGCDIGEKHITDGKLDSILTYWLQLYLRFLLV